MKSATNFHHKVLRGILKLSPVSPIAPLYFLLGELPVLASIHLDTLTLFWGIWANPQTKIHEIVKYLLLISNKPSLTWAAHVRLLCQLYGLPDPLTLITSRPWPKDSWKMATKTAVTVHSERMWRVKAKANSKLSFLNVQATGLTGRPHPVLQGILTTQEVVRARVNVKMLAGDYPCSAYIGRDRGQDTSCRLCKLLHPAHTAPTEDMIHLLTLCRGTSDTRSRYIPELLNIISEYFPENSLLRLMDNSHLTQFILDPTSLNLPVLSRVSPDHPTLSPVLAICRTLCFAVHRERTRQLKHLSA